MEKVAIFIFTGYDGEVDIENKVNNWLTKNADKIVITDRLLTQSEGERTIAIFYTDKH